MARPRSKQPTDGELEILKVLWDLGPSGLAAIRTRLQEEREVATTTVATMLKVMLDKGLVTRRNSAEGYRWSPSRSQESTLGGMLGRLIDRAFDGSARRLVAHVLEDERLSREDIAELRDLLDRSRPDSKDQEEKR